MSACIMYTEGMRGELYERTDGEFAKAVCRVEAGRSISSEWINESRYVPTASDNAAMPTCR